MNAVQEESFLGAIGSDVSWTRRIFINGVCVQMKLDTGVDVAVIPETVYRTMLCSSPRLSQPDRIFKNQMEGSSRLRFLQNISLDQY